MKNYSAIILGLLISISIYSCKELNQKTNKEEININRIGQLIKQLNNSNGSDVLVIAHRADWRNYPENSLEAMLSCIEMGADMIEIDVAKTKDNQLVIMHDRTLDRTTTGEGFVSNCTLDSLRTLHLINGAGIPTKYKIPTLEEALKLCKGRILVNLDKSYEYFNEVYRIAIKTGTQNQIVVKGYDLTADQVLSDFGTKLDTIIFMPIINLDKQKDALKIIDDYQTKLKVKAIEIVFSKDTSEVLNRFSQIKNKGSRVWVNSLWASLNAGFEDDVAVKNKDSIYGWYLRKGVNMIQTDRPQMLIDYLKSKNRHK